MWCDQCDNEEHICDDYTSVEQDGTLHIAIEEYEDDLKLRYDEYAKYIEEFN